jgi:hypothetical protein
MTTSRVAGASMKNNKEGLVIYIAVHVTETDQYTPSWVQWIQRHYPRWAVVDIDDRSDPYFLGYLEKAMDEHAHTLLIVHAGPEVEVRSGSVLALLQQVVRERRSQSTLLLYGRHKMIEKIGVAFDKFYQAISEEKTEKILHSVLGEK